MSYRNEFKKIIEDIKLKEQLNFKNGKDFKSCYTNATLLGGKYD